MYFVFELAVMLIASHISGYVSEWFKQPAVVGQVFCGLILSFIGFKISESIENMAQIGVILLMFIAGLETDVDELKSSIKASSLIAVLGVITPFVLVFLGMYALYPDHSLVSIIFIGIVTTATSVSISVQTLKEISCLQCRQGALILGSAIIDDILGIILLTILVGVVNPNSASIVTVFFHIALLAVIIVAAGFAVVKVISYIGERYDISNMLKWVSIVLGLLLAYISEELGVAAITGAYFAGVIFSLTKFRHQLAHYVNSVSSLLFTPLFFMSIGIGIDVSKLGSAVFIGLVITITSSIGKVVGCGIGSRMGGLGMKESLQIGIGMIPRAEVAIITASLGLQMNMITEDYMAATVFMVLVSTLMTPSLLKWSFLRDPNMRISKS